jgi:sulfur carrier protein
MSAPPSDSIRSAANPAASDRSRAPEIALQLEINGEARGFAAAEAPESVETLLERLHLGGKRVAVAVNRVVVPRSRYPEIELANGDRIEILEAVGGG